MNLHEIYPHNKFLFYIGAISGFIGTYLDTTNKANSIITTSFLIVGFSLVLLSFKKRSPRKEGK
jgi:hypothetical protein